MIQGRCRLTDLHPANWVVWVLNSVLGYTLYFFCTVFLQQFQEQSGKFQVFLSLGFQVAAAVERFAMFLLAKLHPSTQARDRAQVGAMNIFLSHLTFFIFYRAVFRELAEPWTIVLLQVREFPCVSPSVSHIDRSAAVSY
jgi:hypothetical protein